MQLEDADHVERRPLGDPIENCLSFASRCDDAVGAQHGKVLGEGRLRQRDSFVECADRELAVGEQAKQQQPMRIGERLQQPGGRFGVTSHPGEVDGNRGRALGASALGGNSHVSYLPK